MTDMPPLDIGETRELREGLTFERAPHPEVESLYWVNKEPTTWDPSEGQIMVERADIIKMADLVKDESDSSNASKSGVSDES